MVPRIVSSGEWVDGSQVDEFSGWWQSSWFGLYNGQFYPWVYHQNLGWVYVNSGSSEGSWLYHNRLGWMWTMPDVFPYLYLNKRDSWTYLSPERSKTTIYDYDEAEWFEPDTPIEIIGINDLPAGGEILGSGSYYRWDKVTLEARPNDNYNFAGWSGDFISMDPKIEFEALRHVEVKASFLALPSGSTSSTEVINGAREILNQMEHLTDAEREKSLAELLIYGKSATSGLSIIKE